MAFKMHALAALLIATFPAFAQADLPAKMQGKWTSQKVAGGAVTIELVKMEGAEKAQVKVSMTGAVNHYLVPCDLGTVETVAVKSGNAWQIAVPSRRCASYAITLTPVDSKQRFEGEYTADLGGPGTIYLEW